MTIKEQLPESPMPERQIGDSFKPFEKLIVFPKIDEKKLDFCFQELFAYKFTFKGISCSLNINVFEPDALSDPITPLGKIRIVKSGENGKETIEEMPLDITLSSKVPSFGMYEELGKYALEFKFGDNKYYLSLGGDDKNITIKNFEGEEDVSDFNMKNDRGEDAYICFPFNPDLFRDLSVSLVQKNMGPNRVK